MLLHFDYDGVIADSMPHLLALTQRAQQVVGLGRPPALSDYAAIEYLTFENHARCLGIPESGVPAFVDAIFDLQSRELNCPPVYPGIPAVMASLARAHTLAIVTSSLSQLVRRYLQSQGLEACVSVVYGGDLRLSKSERILRSCAASRVPAAQSFMLGDTVGDIQQGKLAGVRTVAASWGFHPRSMLLAAAPDFIADHPSDLLAIFSTPL
jgi:phosphoglycolate phosphatase